MGRWLTSPPNRHPDAAAAAAFAGCRPSPAHQPSPCGHMDVDGRVSVAPPPHGGSSRRGLGLGAAAARCWRWFVDAACWWRRRPGPGQEDQDGREPRGPASGGAPGRSAPAARRAWPGVPHSSLAGAPQHAEVRQLRLLTRVGGFYEMYFEHAEEYGPLLNLKVASKRTNAGPVPMVALSPAEARRGPSVSACVAQGRLPLMAFSPRLAFVLPAGPLPQDLVRTSTATLP